MSENAMFMDTKSVAELLNDKVGTVYSWLHHKQIPNKIYRKLGKRPIFIREELINWILDGAEITKRKSKNFAN